MVEAPGLSINFLKKEEYSGSHSGMRYCLMKADDTIKVCIYPEPWCFDKTPEEEKTWKEFPFSPEGLNEAMDWLDRSYQDDIERWRKR